MTVVNLTFYVFRDTARQWRWNLKAGNGDIIATSGEGYRNKQDCYHCIDLVASSDGAPIVELTSRV